MGHGQPKTIIWAIVVVLEHQIYTHCLTSHSLMSWPSVNMFWRSKVLKTLTIIVRGGHVGRLNWPLEWGGCIWNLIKLGPEAFEKFLICRNMRNLSQRMTLTSCFLKSSCTDKDDCIQILSPKILKKLYEILCSNNFPYKSLGEQIFCKTLL